MFRRSAEEPELLISVEHEEIPRVNFHPTWKGDGPWRA